MEGARIARLLSIQSLTEKKNKKKEKTAESSSPCPGSSSSPSSSSSPKPNLCTDEEKQFFGSFPKHLEFIQLIKECQDEADRKKERVPFKWRGYQSSVFPDLPKFTLDDLKKRLRMALTQILNITFKEKKVKFYLKKKL